MGIFLFFIQIFVLIFHSSQSYDINCQCSNIKLDVLGSILNCDVINNITIYYPEEKIDHLWSDTDITQVKGVSIYNKNIRYFPSSIGIAFQIRSLIIWSGGIRTLTNYELETFQSLEYIDLQGNDIEVLRSDLFDKNPKLQVIFITNNRIFIADPLTFNSLPSLSSLNLKSNPCVNFVATNKNAIAAVSNVLKNSCAGLDYLKFNASLNSFENSFKDITIDDYLVLNSILEDLYFKLKESTFRESFYLLDRLRNIEAALKNLTVDGGNDTDPNFGNETENALDVVLTRLENIENLLKDSQQLSALAERIGKLEESLVKFGQGFLNILSSNEEKITKAQTNLQSAIKYNFDALSERIDFIQAVAQKQSETFLEKFQNSRTEFFSNFNSKIQGVETVLRTFADEILLKFEENQKNCQTDKVTEFYEKFKIFQQCLKDYDGKCGA